MNDRDARAAALERLSPFVGEWTLEAAFPMADTSGTPGRTTFEWILGGQFLAQRSEVDHPAAPDGLSIVGFDERSGGYVQHYFDSRGVARVYAMTFDGRSWTLLRDAPDFTPLDFSQRFTGTFDDDGNVIRGRWETGRDGGGWELDFELTYTRIA